ncbi:hypothetical protein PAMP_023254 [Pampus punctatissimus]
MAVKQHMAASYRGKVERDFWESGHVSGAPPQRRHCSEAPPFVCHLFTLLGQAMEQEDNELVDQQLGLNEAVLLIRCLLNAAQLRGLLIKSRQATSAQRHKGSCSTYPIKKVSHTIRAGSALLTSH